MCRAPFARIGLLLIVCLATSPGRSDELKDLYFGEALFYAYQGHYFEALERLDAEFIQYKDLDEPELDTFHYHANNAEFSLGDFELRYRMHRRAGRAIRAVLEGAVDEQVRNDAAFRLARIHFQKNQLAEAWSALARIEGEVPKAIRDDIEFLKANISLAENDPAAAIKVLEGLQKSNEYEGFVAYNLGIALLQNGQRQEAMQQLDKAGQYPSDDPAVLAIRDKSNLVLGTILLEDGQYRQAEPYLNRVRLDGPFSNQALLSSGWAHVSTGNYDRAVVPWSILADREVTDAAAQEAMLALPFSFGKLNVYGRAATYYARALDLFGVEVKKLNESINGIRDGAFLDALASEEIRNDKNWVIRLRSLPQSPETFYLMELLATHDFQTGLQNYLDLADLRRKLVAWQTSFDSMDDMVSIRRDHYEPLLPDVDKQFRELDSRMRLRQEQHKMLVRRLQDMLTTPRPEFLASREEQAIQARLAHIESTLNDVDAATAEAYMHRIQRLRGLLRFVLETEYHQRLTAFDQHLQGLNAAMAIADEQYQQYVRARQAATHSYEGYDTPISQLRAQSGISIQKLDVLMARQGHLLEVVAIKELVARRDHLENYRDKARFALADSYDRATQAQASLGVQQ